MPRFSTTLNKDQHQWVQAEAERRGRSQADIVRLCIDAVRSGSVSLDAADRTEPVKDGSLSDLRDRITVLEDRLAEIEAAVDSGGLRQRTASADTPDASKDAPKRTPTPTPDVPETVPQRVDDAAVSAAIVAAVDYIEEHGSATMRDLVSDVMPDHDCGYEVPALSKGERYRGSWWRKIVRPALEDHPAITKPRPGQSEWRWGD